MQRWVVRLAVRSLREDRLSAATVKLLGSELGHLNLTVESDAGPPLVELSIVAPDSTAALEYATQRLAAALLPVVTNEVDVELVSVAADVRPK